MLVVHAQLFDLYELTQWIDLADDHDKAVLDNFNSLEFCQLAIFGITAFDESGLLVWVICGA